jgi:hypothetical protein
MNTGLSSLAVTPIGADLKNTVLTAGPQVLDIGKGRALAFDVRVPIHRERT